MRAIVSDIHANMEALQAVLADMEEQEVEQIICLGDVVGYGPNPRECIDLARDNFDVALMGNHEQALMVQMEGASFNLKARGSIDWTREQFDMLGEHREENRPRWDFLGDLEEMHETDDIIFVHGTPREPTTEYLYPRDVDRPEKLEDIFSMIVHLCFVGHTHVAGIWTEDMIFLTPKEVNYRYSFTEKKTIVNVGSVGQPRDGDLRASYVILKDDSMVFRRVPYPLKETAAKIRKIPELDPFLAERLLQGR